MVLVSGHRDMLFLRSARADWQESYGRMDLLVTTSELWPEAKQTLRAYRNTLDDAGNWIGFRFREAGGGRSPVGVTVSLHYAGHSLIRQLVTGDSYRSQSANTLHFGLGSATVVDRARNRLGQRRPTPAETTQSESIPPDFTAEKISGSVQPWWPAGLSVISPACNPPAIGPLALAERPALWP